MEAAENPVLESRAERIARYKAERRRELAERFGAVEELPSKCVRRDERGLTQTPGGALNSDDLGERINGRTQEAQNGLEADVPAEDDSLRSQDSGLGLDGPQLRTRVSVGQLRSALLQQTESGAEPDKDLDAGRSTFSLDLAVKPGSEGGRRRARRYLPGVSGSGRKSGERFRTQPITAGEMEESGGLMDEDDEVNGKADVKTDDRAEMSVAAKMSLFKELEKSAAPEVPVPLKPRSAGSAQERRTRRSNDPRFLTQPITCEEKEAISAPTPAGVRSAPVEPKEDEDESCKMSMREKLALFNKLSLPGRQGSGPPDGPPERRRQKGSRYRTQPITVEEVSLLQQGPVQLPAFSLGPHLSSRHHVSSTNLRPSEVRLSQLKPDAAEPDPVHQSSQSSEPGLKGILKKNRSVRLDWSGPDAGLLDAPFGHERDAGRGRGAETFGTTEEAEARRETSGTPWRQRARIGRETVAWTPTGPSSEPDALRDGRRRTTPQDGDASCERNRFDSTWRRQHEDERENERKVDDEQPQTQRSAVVSAGCAQKIQESEEASETSLLGSVGLRLWEPVFASVYSVRAPQYVVRFSQANLSFEAQEVSSPRKSPIGPEWRPKTKGTEDELQGHEEQDAAIRSSPESDGEISTKLSTVAPVHLDEGLRRADAPVCVDEGQSRIDAPVCVDEGRSRIDAPVCVDDGWRRTEGRSRTNAPVCVDEGRSRTDAPVCVDEG
ncbi:supervillin, partial [Nematolebias whitei]|uniref:supervillin n=1 Tax=Nematolebias whitei TaxID=451745 RepID=UPI001899F386